MPGCEANEGAEAPVHGNYSIQDRFGISAVLISLHDAKEEPVG